VKKISISLLILGAISIVVGILSFIFAYPYSDGPNPNSGPSNGWELILMLSYEGQTWYLLIGIALSFFSVTSLFKQRKI
jgi:hypothetical protein